MATINLTIEPEFCGPISMGTVAVIRALVAHLSLPVDEAEALVDRCVTAGEQVAIPAPTRLAAEALLAALQRVPAAPRIHATLLD